MTQKYIDLVAKDKDGRVVLIGEVKAGRMRHEAEEQLKHYLQGFNEKIPFGMTVNSEKIRIFKWTKNAEPEPTCVLQTGDVLRFYEPDFERKQILETYLTTLTEAWLRDLAYHWKSTNPPASVELEAIGLLAQLADGTTEDEVALDLVR